MLVSKLKNWAKTLFIILVGAVYALAIISIVLMYWYWAVNLNKPEVIGVSFSQPQAERYGVDWQANYSALLDDLNFKNLRIAAYWDRTEPTQGQFDFSQTDWMVEQAKKRGAKVTLNIGQKLIRSPECYYPSWLNKNDPAQVQTQIDPYLAAVVNRYKDNPTIEAWQVENEFLLKSFGNCPGANLTNSQLKREVELVRGLDKTRPIVLTQSDQFGFPLKGPFADVFGISLYRYVWSSLFDGYYRYPQDGNYNWLKAAWIQFLTGQQIKIHELQAEAWGPVGNEYLSFNEASKTMSPRQFSENIAYGRQSQIKNFDLWGAEWWYWLKENGRPEMWQSVKDLVANSKSAS
ncbi:cellulase family glycosylhydrolase [Candidatus Saccharibacteria bacterium]|nr:cellulase family glycosylhydrolase [Candidatus Saccharibacteria bacterium]